MRWAGLPSPPPPCCWRVAPPYLRPGTLGQGSVSFKQRDSISATAASALPPPQCGLRPTLSRARRSTQRPCWPTSPPPRLPRSASCQKEQSPLRLAARICEDNVWGVRGRQVEGKARGRGGLSAAGDSKLVVSGPPIQPEDVSRRHAQPASHPTHCVLLAHGAVDRVLHTPGQLSRCPLHRSCLHTQQHPHPPPPTAPGAPGLPTSVQAWWRQSVRSRLAARQKS